MSPLGEVIDFAEHHPWLLTDAQMKACIEEGFRLQVQLARHAAKVALSEDKFWDDLDTMERIEDESPLLNIRDGLYTLDGFLAYKVGDLAWWMDEAGAVHPADLWDLRFDGGVPVTARELFKL